MLNKPNRSGAGIAPPFLIMAYKFNPAKLSKAVIDKRQREGINVRDASKQTGGKISPSGFFRIEEKAVIDAERLGIICKWLGMPITEFYY